MHIFERGNCKFHYNGDYSGQVYIEIPESKFGGDGGTVMISCDILLAFVAEFIRQKRIETIEKATMNEILTGMYSHPIKVFPYDGK